MRKTLAAILFLPLMSIAQDVPKTENKAAAEKKSDQKKAVTKKGTLKLIDLNSATEAELRQLPGVDAALAKKIIENRPYVTVEDLRRSGIPVEVERDVRTRVTVTPRTGTSDRQTPRDEKAAKPEK
jgi:DNA uptake protein ComE-like DNA-binding protein